MDKQIKKEKKTIDKGMDKLAKMDKKNDTKHEKMGMKKAMKKKGCKKRPLIFEGSFVYDFSIIIFHVVVEPLRYCSRSIPFIAGISS